MAVKSTLLIHNLRTEWFILAAAIGFGLARLAQQNLGLLFHVDIPGEPGWALRGMVDGVITVLVLGRMVREWKWKALLTFAICWAILYLVVFVVILDQGILLLTSLVFSLAPVLSVILSSLWAKRRGQWQTYFLILIGWILAWTIGQTVADYLDYAFRWAISDTIAGGIGLWLTTELLKTTPIIFKPTTQTGVILIVLIVVFVAIGYLYQSNQDPFAGAVGEWWAEGDQSHMTLSIERVSRSEYFFVYRREQAPFCKGGLGVAEFSARTATDRIRAPAVFSCTEDPDLRNEVLFDLFYDSDGDRIIQNPDITWNRKK